MHNNEFTGTISSEIGFLTNLGRDNVWIINQSLERAGLSYSFSLHFYMTEELYLASNMLNGTIPSEVGLLTSLGTCHVVVVVVGCCDRLFGLSINRASRIILLLCFCVHSLGRLVVGSVQQYVDRDHPDRDRFVDEFECVSLSLYLFLARGSSKPDCLILWFKFPFDSFLAPVPQYFDG